MWASEARERVRGAMIRRWDRVTGPRGRGWKRAEVVGEMVDMVGEER